MDFKPFRDAIESQYNKLQLTGDLYTVQIDKDQLWEVYLASFPVDSNPIFRERTEHDCTACKSFVRNIGPVVAIIDDKLVSVWDIQSTNINPAYQEVASAMNNLIISLPIENIFRFDCRIQLHTATKEILPDNSIRVWNHFSATVAKPFKVTDGSIAQQLGEAKQRKELFQRALSELTPSAVDTALDLCDSIYRGTEFKALVDAFRKAQDQFDLAPNPELWLWSHYKHIVATIRNTAIGTLLIDLSDNVDIEVAVSKFEKVVAPQNYKRTSAVVTPAMIKAATKTISDLGIEPSLTRRYAHIEDISVNNVLWADKSTAQVMKHSLESLLLKDTITKAKPQANATELSLTQFIQDILPTAESIELLVENKHSANLVSLITESTPNSPNLFKWNNPFSWSYNGGATDSMKERVKAMGGNTDGVLRFSIQWNTPDQPNSSDLDAHCNEPNGHIYFGNKVGRNSGTLDVDITTPNGIAVENIIYTNLSKMVDGTYTFYINNYHQRSGKGWSAEIEVNGQIYEFSSTSPIRDGEDIEIATVFKSGNTLKFESFLDHSQSTKKIWNIQTQSFHKVTAIMHSPNFWDDQQIGNKHTFFMLDDCSNPEPTRGIYNEFLSNELQTHRKAFDLIGEKFKCNPTPGNLSGLGFSHTVQNDFTVKVNNRQYIVKIKD